VHADLDFVLTPDEERELVNDRSAIEEQLARRASLGSNCGCSCPKNGYGRLASRKLEVFLRTFVICHALPIVGRLERGVELRFADYEGDRARNALGHR
jgi:hypothetical protein